MIEEWAGFLGNFLTGGRRKMGCVKKRWNSSKPWLGGVGVVFKKWRTRGRGEETDRYDSSADSR